MDPSDRFPSRLVPQNQVSDISECRQHSDRELNRSLQTLYQLEFVDLHVIPFFW